MNENNDRRFFAGALHVCAAGDVATAAASVGGLIAPCGSRTCASAMQQEHGANSCMVPVGAAVADC